MNQMDPKNLSDEENKLVKEVVEKYNKRIEKGTLSKVQKFLIFIATIVLTFLFFTYLLFFILS